MPDGVHPTGLVRSAFDTLVWVLVEAILLCPVIIIVCFFFFFFF